MKEFLTKPFLDLKNRDFLSLYSLKYLNQYNAEFYNPRNTAGYVIHFYISGEGCYKVDKRTVEVHQGSILFSPLGLIKQYATSKDVEGFVLIFSEAFFSKTSMKNVFLHNTQLFNSLDKLVYFPVEKRMDELMMLFQLIIDQLRRPYSELQEQILLNYVFSILLISEEIYTKEIPTFKITNEIKLIKEFKSLFNNELNRRYSVRFYTEQMNVSMSTLNRAFRKYENSSPKKWINKRLVKEIQIELNRMEMSVGEIAFKFGFSEVTNFIKFYKGQTGITPKQFRSQ